MSRFERHLDVVTQEAIRQSLANIAAAVVERYGDKPHSAVEETGWLIEWPSAELQTRWWHPGVGWTIHADRAIRYARKEDAEAAIKTGVFCAGVVATEHAWVAPSSTGGGDGR